MNNVREKARLGLIAYLEYIDETGVYSDHDRACAQTHHFTIGDLEELMEIKHDDYNCDCKCWQNGHEDGYEEGLEEGYDNGYEARENEEKDQPSGN